MKIELVDKVSDKLSDTVSNFIYNRYDLYCESKNVQVYHIYDEKNSLYVELQMISDYEAKLGIWLYDISEDVISKVVKSAFAQNKNLKTIYYYNSLISYKNTGIPGNHFRIVLPDTKDELSSRLSSKGRYNIKREKRILEQEVDGYVVTDYSISDAPQYVINKYYDLKKRTHKIDYDYSATEYMKKKGVTNIYTLEVGANKRIISMVLSCEQCPIVYLENLTYDIEFAKYSPGQILYDFYLEKLIEKRKKEVYLLGGQLSYKRRYGSIEEILYYGEIDRSKIKQFIRLKCFQIRHNFQKIFGNMSENKKQTLRRIIAFFPIPVKKCMSRLFGVTIE